MKNGLLSKIFSSGIQAIAVQVMGGVFFIVISRYLSKEDFGIINWANGVALVLTMTLSFGLDQVVLRRIATTGSDWAAAAYLFHAFVGSILAFVLLYVLYLAAGSQSHNGLTFLPWFFVSQALIFTGNPLKQLLNAKQAFTPYAIIALLSNSAKLLLAYFLISKQILSISTTGIVLICCSGFELAGLILYVLVRKGFRFYFKRIAYLKLLKEAFPQYVAVLFDACHARADVILLGILSTQIATGEYSLAYRAYEIARLPLTVLSPILLVRFARMLNTGNKLETDQKSTIQNIFTSEIFVAMMIPLLLNILWSPMLDRFYNGTYGSSNAFQFLILSICIPFQFYINMLWTLCFAARKYKQVSRIIAITAIINIAFNIIAIKYWGGEGAAVVALITSILQVIAYHKLVARDIMIFSSRSFLGFLFIASVVYFVCVNAISNVYMQLLVAMASYIGLSLLFKQIGKKHLATVMLFIKK